MQWSELMCTFCSAREICPFLCAKIISFFTTRDVNISEDALQRPDIGNDAGKLRRVLRIDVFCPNALISVDLIRTRTQGLGLPPSFYVPLGNAEDSCNCLKMATLRLKWIFTIGFPTPDN